MGAVISQAYKIDLTVSRFRPIPLVKPIPMMEDADTWVVDTGIPSRLAPNTRTVAIRLAENP